MSEDLEAKIGVSLDPKKFEEGQRKIEKGFDKIEQKGKQSAGKAGDAIEDLGNEATETGNKVASAGDKGASGMDKLGDSAQEAERDMAAVSVGVLGLTQNIGGLSQGILEFDKKVVALSKTELGAEKMAVALERATQDLAAAMDEGTISALEHARAVEDLELQYRELRLEEENVLAEQNALNAEFVNFGLNISSTVALSLITMNQLLNEAQKTFIRTKVAMIATRTEAVLMSRTFGSLIFNVNKFRIAMIGATFSLGGLKTGVRAFMTALGPLGIAMIAIGVAMEVWQTNAFGIQEKMAELWELLKKFIPILQVLEVAVKGIFPEAQAEVEGFDASIQGTTLSVKELEEKFLAGEITAEQFSEAVSMAHGNMQTFDDSTGEATETLTGFDLVLGQTTTTSNNFNDSLGRVGTTMASVPDWYRRANSELERYNQNLKTATKETEGFSAATLAHFAKLGINPFGSKKNDSDIIEETNLPLARLLLAQAAIEESNGNREGALFLQNQVRKLGGNVSGDPSILKFARQLKLTRGPFGNISSNLNFGSGEFGVQSLAQAGLIQQRGTSPRKGSPVRGISGFKGRDRNPRGRHDKLVNKLRAMRDQIAGGIFDGAFLDFARATGIDTSFSVPVFGNNSPLSSTERQNRILQEFRNTAGRNILEIKDRLRLAQKIKTFDSTVDLLEFAQTPSEDLQLIIEAKMQETQENAELLGLSFGEVKRRGRTAAGRQDTIGQLSFNQRLGRTGTTASIVSSTGRRSGFSVFTDEEMLYSHLN